MPDAIVERDGHTILIATNHPGRFNALSGADAVEGPKAFAGKRTPRFVRR